MQASTSRETSPREAGGDQSRLEHLGEVIEHAVAPAAGAGADHRLHPPQHAPRLRGPAVPRGGQEGGARLRLPALPVRGPLSRGAEAGADPVRRAPGGAGAGPGRPGRGEDPCFGTRLDLRLAMLQYPLRTGPTEELVWYVAEANALRRVRAGGLVRGPRPADRRDAALGHARPPRRQRPGADGVGGDAAPAAASRTSLAELLDRFGESTIESWSDDDWEGFTLQALWRVCCDGVRDLPAVHPAAAAAGPAPRPAARGDRGRRRLAGQRAADPVLRGVPRPGAGALATAPPRRGVLPRLLLASTASPAGRRTAGCAGSPRSSAGWRTSGSGRWNRSGNRSRSSGVAEEEWESFLSATLLALRAGGGWSARSSSAATGRSTRCRRGAWSSSWRSGWCSTGSPWPTRPGPPWGSRGPLQRASGDSARGRIDPHWPPSVEQRAFLVFQLAQVLGLSPDVLHRLGKHGVGDPPRGDRDVLRARAAADLPPGLRAAVPHPDARRHRAPLAARRRAGRASPRFQVVCCLDEREESFRRHLEELAPDVETFGAAGFYSVAMYYRGAADAHFVPLCPVVIRPQHWVTEEVGDELGEAHRRRARTRRALGTASHQFHVGSRSFAVGAAADRRRSACSPRSPWSPASSSPG